MYGGRAIDSFDRRILTIYMDEYLGDFIFDTFQPFHFFHNKEVDYKIPGGAADPKERFVGASLRRRPQGRSGPASQRSARSLGVRLSVSSVPSPGGGASLVGGVGCHMAGPSLGADGDGSLFLA